MSPGRLIRVVLFLGVFFAHYSLQAHVWRVHVGEFADPQLNEDQWAVVSLPLFTVVPQRLQPVHFEALLFTNSLLWAAAAAWLSGFLPMQQVLRWWDRSRTVLAPVPATAVWSAPEVDQRPAVALTAARRHWSQRPGTRTLGNGRYEVIARLGGGAFANVYRARDHVRGLEVAIKMLGVQSVPASQREDFRAAFQQEAALAGRLDHHGIVAVFDHDATAEEPYIVMSLVKGGTLRDRLDALPAGKHLDWVEVVEIGEQVAAALEYARRQGVKAHRDIKPANIFRGDSGYKVGDLGIVSRQAGEKQPSPVPAGGTPGYMAPEQVLAAQTVDWRADLFALCVVLYEALTGRLPYGGVDVRGAAPAPLAVPSIVAAANANFTPLRQLLPTLPAHVAAAIDRGLEFDRAERFVSWEAFGRALRGDALGTAGEARPPGRQVSSDLSLKFR